MENNQKVIDKIQKLFALGSSSSESESNSAVNKAHELLVRYNLSMADIESKNKEFVTAMVDEGKTNKPSWQRNMFCVVTEHFMVQLVGSLRWLGRGNRDKLYKMVGTKVNVKLANYTIDFLLQTFKRLGDDFMKTYKKSDEGKMAKIRRGYIGHMVKIRNSYYHGLVLGLQKSLEKQVKVEQEKGLMVVKDADLMAHLKKTTREGKKGANNAQINGNAYHAGKDDGKNIKLTGAVENKSTSSGRTLAIA